MPYEMLVGLMVTNESVYQSYRENMLPILEHYGGVFGYDFKIAEVLRAKTPAPINRVFTICFLSREASKRFFSDREYLEIKEKFFAPAVSDTTLIAEYET